jgi:hypothetical protein
VYPGCSLRLFTKADNLEINYNAAMPAEHKAILLGAVFLIDFMFFEQRQNDNNNGVAISVD